MKVEILENIEIDSIGVGKATQANISASNMMFAISAVSKNLYSDLIGSIIRELTSNALDANRLDNVNNPILISLYCDIDSEITFSVKDDGIGMSPQFIEKHYMSYFDSTKRLSQDFIGGWGIGSKSPLGYVDFFYIETKYSGTKYTYILNKTPTLPEISLLNEVPTSERNGTKIYFSVKYDDLFSFVVKVSQQLYLFKNIYFNFQINPLVLQNTLSYSNILYASKLQDLATKVDKFNNRLIYEHDLFYHTSNNEDSLRISLDCVSYKLDHSLIEPEFNEYIKKNNIGDYYQYDMNFLSGVHLKFNIGDLNVTLNRENIEYTELSINNIIKKYIQVFDLISNNIIRHYEYIDNIAEYHHCIDNYDSSLGVILNFNNQSNNNNDNKNIILRVNHSDSYFKILLTRKLINYNEPFNTLEYLNIRNRIIKEVNEDFKVYSPEMIEGSNDDDLINTFISYLKSISSSERIYYLLNYNKFSYLSQSKFSRVFNKLFINIDVRLASGKTSYHDSKRYYKIYDDYNVDDTVFDSNKISNIKLNLNITDNKTWKFITDNIITNIIIDYQRSILEGSNNYISRLHKYPGYFVYKTIKRYLNLTYIKDAIRVYKDIYYEIVKLGVVPDVPIEHIQEEIDSFIEKKKQSILAIQEKRKKTISAKKEKTDIEFSLALYNCYDYSSIFSSSSIVLNHDEINKHDYIIIRDENKKNNCITNHKYNFIRTFGKYRDTIYQLQPVEDDQLVKNTNSFLLCDISNYTKIEKNNFYNLFRSKIIKVDDLFLKENIYILDLFYDYLQKAVFYKLFKTHNYNIYKANDFSNYDMFDISRSNITFFDARIIQKIWDFANIFKSTIYVEYYDLLREFLFYFDCNTDSHTNHNDHIELDPIKIKENPFINRYKFEDYFSFFEELDASIKFDLVLSSIEKYKYILELVNRFIKVNWGIIREYTNTNQPLDLRELILSKYIKLKPLNKIHSLKFVENET